MTNRQRNCLTTLARYTEIRFKTCHFLLEVSMAETAASDLLRLHIFSSILRFYELNKALIEQFTFSPLFPT